MSPSPQLLATVATIAKGSSLDYDLVCAVVEQESNWNNWAYRYEPAFQEKYVNHQGLAPTETIGRSISWGLMQVMGEVAREEGFKQDLPSLCIPETGLLIGCAVLSRKFKAAEGNYEKTLLLWNGGDNPQYPAQVLARIGNYKLKET